MLNKEKILSEARERLAAITEAVKQESQVVVKTIARLRQRVNNFASPDGMVEAVILANNQEREKQLEKMSGSPYFVRLDVDFGDNLLPRVLYLGKFQLSEKNIYSWVSPIAQLRFGAVGRAEYKLPNGKIRNGKLNRKDQFMIVDGQIVFMASESTEHERTLIHQDNLAARKSEFILPEIVAQMEKAQDEVIRANHLGSLLIAGPAGSGKTTLAFHRIAYLVQSPDTAKLFPGHNIIVFVQDESTQKYFSAILPQLGIEEVVVTTFEQWAFEVLGLTEFRFVNRFGENESVRNNLEFYKNSALKDIASRGGSLINVASFLKNYYKSSLPGELQRVLEQQLQNKLLDRFDLTILLKIALASDQGIYMKRRVVVENKRGDLKIELKKIRLAYSFIVVDEAENYLAEQISLIKASVNENQAMLYVGDLAQQTKIGTIKSWEEVHEDFDNGRKVVLDKVYRNTKQILEYVNSQGYNVNIPLGLKEGEVVIEKYCQNVVELKENIEQIFQNNSLGTIGLLYQNGEAQLVERLGLKTNESVKIMSYNEAQGVEFESVILLKKAKEEYVGEFKEELEKIQRDLWYVALTRSMNKLIILNY